MSEQQASLTVPRAEAHDRLASQIERGRALANAAISSEADLEEQRHAYYTWYDYNLALLKRLFSTNEEAEEYQGSLGFFSVGPTSFDQEIRDHLKNVSDSIRRLESVVTRLELFDEPPVQALSSDASQEKIAAALVKTLDQVKEGGFKDPELAQRAIELNSRLAPTYTRMYGGVPEITVTYPESVWWPRAKNAAMQALAAAKSGHYGPQPSPMASPTSTTSRRVFIVHGRDHSLKEAVARFITKIAYDPVILHEQPNRGQTLIEKFEREAPDAAFAVVLLTPDDKGGLRSEEDLSPRARQNVVFEFGYFVGLLGRPRVVALVPESNKPKPPSDIDGLIYIPVKSPEDDGWRLRLAKEMRDAGLDVDLNRVI